ncbi:tRNA lysidine(34) synthetase TilS [Castellaniella sp. S9]|uniref:tRNA lysidine(34) synthetase TilS n=1 Tax=Castellaniella sp. S9 TaxID=2993652 RepID=UPI0022B56741|nr:tRNA lysidine(34) synthetase TilS [Castellaniella sp. S9]
MPRQADCDPELLQSVREVLAGCDGPVAVALSGGADSAMLALHAARAAAEAHRTLHAFHVHHGLQAEADRWQAHAHRLAAQLGMSCHSLRVDVSISGDGMESAARDARYGAFAQLAALAGVRTILLAHHRDDQAETVLLRLLRGAGPLALGAMAPDTVRDGLRYLRPWLAVPRARILRCAERYGARSGWRPVDDPSNADPRYTRAALRERLAPVLDDRWPGWRDILVRHAAQARELTLLVDEAARADWAGLDPAPDAASFSLAAWRLLPPVRQAQVLRHWLGLHGLRAPTAARLDELMRQLRGLHALGHDRRMRLRHDGRWIACVRGRVVLEPKTQVE